MNSGNYFKQGITFTLVAGVTMEAIAMHDPHWHIETNEPQSSIIYRNAPIVVTSSMTITPGTGSLSFG